MTLEAPSARGAGLRDHFWLIAFSASLLLVLLPFSSYIASLPLIRDEWAMTNVQAAVVFSAYLIGYALSSLVLVPLTDRVSPGPILLAGYVVVAVSNLLFPLLARDVWTASLFRFLGGAGHVAAYIPGIQMVALRYAGTKRGTAVAVFVSASYAGTTLSYVFMGQLLAVASTWRVAYFITALAGLVGVGVAYLMARSDHAALARPRHATAGAGRLALWVLRDRPVALVIVAYALHTAELYLSRLWLPLLLGATLVRAGADPLKATSLAATLAGLMFMTGIAGAFWGGYLSDRVGRSAGGVLLFTVSGACSFVAGWLVGLPPAFLMAVGFVYGFATAADSAIYSTAVTELAPRDRIGSTQAVQSFIGFAIGAIAPVVAGSILDTARSSAGWGLAFSFNGILAVVGVLALLWLRSLPRAVQMAAGRR